MTDLVAWFLVFAFFFATVGLLAYLIRSRDWGGDVIKPIAPGRPPPPPFPEPIIRDGVMKMPLKEQPNVPQTPGRWVKVEEGVYQFKGRIPSIGEYLKAKDEGIDLCTLPEADYAETEP